MQEYEEEEICQHCHELEQENTELKQQILDLRLRVTVRPRTGIPHSQ